MSAVVMRSGHAKSPGASPLDRAALGVTVLDPEDAALAARLVARHALDPDDGDLIADVLGLDDGVRTWHAERRTAERIMRLADSVDVSTCDGCGYRRTSANHRSLCGAAS